MSMIDQKAIVEALAQVDDPELGMNIVDLGLVYNISVSKGNVLVEISLTYPGCPLGPDIMKDIQEKVGTMPDVKKVETNIVWIPSWQQAMIHPDTIEELKFLGRMR